MTRLKPDEASFLQSPPTDLSEPQPGWVSVDSLTVSHKSFVSGEPEGNRIRVHYFQRLPDGALIARAWFGPGAQGPRGHAHGGSMAALLDEAMGIAGWINGHPVLAAQITIQFRAMLPLGSEVLVEAWVERVEGRKVFIKGKLEGRNGTLHSEGEGIFIRMDAPEYQSLAQAAQARLEKLRAGQK